MACFGRTRLVLALLLPALSGCGTWEALKPATFEPRTTGLYDVERLTDREKVLFRSDFSVALNQFEDKRTPRSLMAQQPKGIIYQYDPDDLVQGVTYRLPVLLETYLTYRPRKDKHYQVDVAVTELQTFIKTGSFLDGRFGRYAVRLELAVVVRRPDSRVVLARHYRQRLEAPRKSYDGRNPTAETDRAAMFDLVDMAMRRTADNIGWDIRRNDYLRWDVQDDPSQRAPAPLKSRPTLLLPEEPSSQRLPDRWQDGPNGVTTEEAMEVPEVWRGIPEGGAAPAPLDDDGFSPVPPLAVPPRG